MKIYYLSSVSPLFDYRIDYPLGAFAVEDIKIEVFELLLPVFSEIAA